MDWFVDRIGEDYYGGTAGGRTGQGDSEAADDKHLVETLKVAIVLLWSDGTEDVARLLECGSDVCEFGHDTEWGGERVGGHPVFFLI